MTKEFKISIYHLPSSMRDKLGDEFHTWHSSKLYEELATFNGRLALVNDWRYLIFQSEAHFQWFSMKWL
jgi:hypothetical protein